MSQIRWRFNGMPNSYTTEQLEGAGWTYPQICQYGKPFYENSVLVWKGPEDGLPPVGLRVEVEALLPNHEGPQWVVGRVAAHDTPVYMPVKVALVELVDPRAGHGLQYIFGEVENFRAITTADQRGAESRAQQVAAMCDEVGLGHLSKSVCQALYDAGYRKVQP